MKRDPFILSVLIICIVTFVGGMVAYFMSEDKAHSDIITGKVGIKLQEWADEARQTPFNNQTGIMPGMSVTKIAEAKNTGTADEWIRVRILKDIRLEGGGTPDLSLVEVDINLTDWIQGEDGFLYYKKILKPGEVTEPIFTTVTFNATMGNEYQNATANVFLLGHAVQTANNATVVTEVVGWPAE